MSQWTVKQDVVLPNEDEAGAGGSDVLALTVQAPNGGHVSICILSTPDGVIAYGADAKDKRPGRSPQTDMAMSFLLARGFAFRVLVQRLAKVAGVRA